MKLSPAIIGHLEYAAHKFAIDFSKSGAKSAQFKIFARGKKVIVAVQVTPKTL